MSLETRKNTRWYVCFLYVSSQLELELEYLKHLRLQARHLCHIRRLGNSEQGASPSQQVLFGEQFSLEEHSFHL